MGPGWVPPELRGCQRQRRDAGRGPRGLAGRVRAPVHRRSEPDDAGRRRLGGRFHGRLGRRDQASGGGAAGRAGPGRPALPRAGPGAAQPRAGRGDTGHRRRRSGSSGRPAPLLSGAGFGVLLPDWVRTVPARAQAHHPVQAAPRADRATEPEVRPERPGRLPLRPGARRRRSWTRASWPSWPGSRSRWSGCAASGWSSTTGTCQAGAAVPGAQPVRDDDRPADVLLAGLHGSRRRPAGGRGGRRRLARRPALRPGRPPARAGRRRRPASDGDAAAVPGARPGLAGLPRPSRPGRRPRRRHGPGQDRPDCSPCCRTSDEIPAPGRRAGPTLLVCPMSVVGNWQREAARFTPGAAGARPPRRGPAPRRRARPRAGREPTW